MSESVERVLLGKVLAPFGVQGWLKIHSESRPIADIGRYRTWQLKLGDGWVNVRVKSFKAQGKGLIAKLEGVNDRQQAEAMAGVAIAVDSAQLQALPEGEYYWRDLIGLRVLTVGGLELGVVDHLLETGANDVLVLRGERERLLPWVMGQVVVSVDLAGRQMIVDWDPEF